MPTLMPPRRRWLLLLPGLLLGSGRIQPVSAQEGTLVRLPTVAPFASARSAPTPGSLVSVDATQARPEAGPGWIVPAAVGAVVGGTSTYLWLHAGGSTSRCDRSSNQDAMSRGECAASVALGAAVGAGLGVLVARLLRTERRAPVSVGRIELSLGRHP